MPEQSRILAPATVGLLSRMLSERRVVEHLPELLDEEEAGIEVPEAGLLAVRVPDAWWRRRGGARVLGRGVVSFDGARDPGPSPWHSQPGGYASSLTRDAGLRRRFRWLVDVAPPASLVAWLDAAARATATPIAYLHWREHGDDPYYELALLFGGPRGPEAVLRQTCLVDLDDDGACVRHPPGEVSSAVGSVVAAVLAHIGSPSRVQRLPPDCSPRIPWERCRVDPSEHR
jgi:hypothetical protein